MDFLDKQIARPKSWEKFEDLACALFASIWRQPHTQKNGRTGQAQAGVDVYGRPDFDPQDWHGVQCKGKNKGYGAKVTAKEFDAELAKAESFEPPLTHWTLASTASNDATLQKYVRMVSAERVKAGKFPVEIMFWETILARLAEHPAVLRQFYPEHAGPAIDPLAVLRAASDSALLAIDDQFRLGETSVALPRGKLMEEASSALSGNNILRVTGEGGMGKSVILRRTAKNFDGPKFALKDNRISATSLSQYFAQLGISEDPQALINQIAVDTNCLCVIDGADRILLSERRSVAVELFSCIARSPNRERWRIITSARQYQGQDVVSSALRDAGFTDDGTAQTVPAIDDEDAAILAKAFPDFATILGRNDLSGQNRSPFLIREMLRHWQAGDIAATELDLANAWATAGDTHRAKALSELGGRLVAQPSSPPTRAEIDALGCQQLIDEGSLAEQPKRDAVVLANDVHEDWLLARTLSASPALIPRRLHTAAEPLWWQRAARLAGQILLETGRLVEWRDLVIALRDDDELDPNWARTVLSAPLYSEQAQDILPQIEPYLLADEGRLLDRLLDTLVISETRLNDNVLANGKSLGMEEVEVQTLAATLKMPVWRSWGAFLKWSLPKWEDWPARFIPRLARIADIFARSTAQIPNGYSQAIAAIAQEWLIEIEDGTRNLNWDDRREPFGLQLNDYEGWKKVEKQLRYVLRDCLLSAQDTVSAYLERISSVKHFDGPRRHLLEYPGALPKMLPTHWADMCIAHFLPPRRRHPRPGDGYTIIPEFFSWHDFNDAGIGNNTGFHPSAPTRAGFAELFEADEAEALRLLHRLELRASVFWRWYSKCNDRQRPRPLVLQLPSGPVQLWGNETVYRWSRGVLGSHVLGSAYLALDDWMHTQAKAGRPVAELIGLALQSNGLVASASPCIALLKQHINTPYAIDSAGSFLGEPRLWDYDIKCHIDDQGGAYRIGFWSRDDVHFQSVEANYQRRKDKLPLSHSLLLPFNLLAGEDAKAAFAARCTEWTAADLADFEPQLDDEAQMAAFAERIERCRSDSDPAQISVKEGPDNQIIVNIEPPAQALPAIAALDQSRILLNDASGLAVRAERSREAGTLEDGQTLSDALQTAQSLEPLLSAHGPIEGFAMLSKLVPAAIAGTAALIAKFADDAFLAENMDWVRTLLLAGARLQRDADERAYLFDQSILSFDAQVMAAWGLAALACRHPGDPEVETSVYALTVQRLQAVTVAVLQGLDWSRRDDFARKVHILALDSCIIDVGHWWRGEDQSQKAAIRTTKRRWKLANNAQKTNELSKAPDLPPHPYRSEWVWTGKWRKPLQRLKLRSPVVLDWNRAEAVFKQVDWAQLGADEQTRLHLEHYLTALVEWTQAFSEEDERRHDSRYPYEWGHALAQAIGKLSAAFGIGGLWESFLAFKDERKAERLVGNYLDTAVRELMFSERKPDERFWNAWKPAAEWVMAHKVPAYRSSYDNLSEEVRAAGLVGPYMTPIPPNSPWLEDFLPWIDGWVTKTCHLPSAVVAVLPIVERMSIEQRRTWFVAWLPRIVNANNADASFWTYGNCGDKAAALLKPLAQSPDIDRAAIRKALSFIADAGSPVATEVLPLFASKRPD